MPIFTECQDIYFIGEQETEELGKVASKTGNKQCFSEIIQQHSASNPFIDEEFPHSDESIGKPGFDTANENTSFPDWDKKFVWKRVNDLAPNLKPVFAERFGDEEDEFSRHDIIQGVLGDCWFICVMAEITRHPQWRQFVIPNDNKTGNNDSGAYHFRIYHHGIWIDTVVDDWIPCAAFYGEKNGLHPVALKPFAMDGKIKFWSCLVEKAYAKVNGCYANIEINFPRYAMEDLTGGLGYTLDFNPQWNNDAKNAIFKDLSKYFNEVTTLVAFGTSMNKIKQQDMNGLRCGHAYSMTGVTTLEDGTKLVRLRNPWGQVEWQGDWSDKSIKWQSISETKKKEIGLIVREDGEFWISFDDLVHYFQAMEVLTDIHSILKLGLPSLKYSDQTNHGKWNVQDEIAGGYLVPWQNQQYIFFLGNNGLVPGCDIRIGLSLKTSIAEASKYCYGFQVYQVFGDLAGLGNWEWGKFGYGRDFFEDSRTKLVLRTPGGVNNTGVGYYGREITVISSLVAGTYLVVPVTFEPNLELDFVLRIWAQQESSPEIVNQIFYATGDAVTGEVKSWEEHL